MNAGLQERNSFLKHYVAMIWEKEDSLNKGNDYKVSFDDNSRMSSMMTRGYLYGWNDIRFIVKNIGQFYISEIEKNYLD